jgi:hypothetical protein
MPVAKRCVFLARISFLLKVTFLALVAASCASTQSDSHLGTSLVVGVVDTSVLHRHLGSATFRRADPPGGFWELGFGVDGYFWGRLPSGEYRLERISLYDPSDPRSRTELGSPLDEKSFDITGHGGAFFLGAFKLDVTLEKTRTTMGGAAIFIFSNAIGIQRVEKPTEKEALSWLLKKLGDDDPAARDSIRKRLALMGGPLKD